MKVYPNPTENEEKAQLAGLAPQERLMRSLALTLAFLSVFGIVAKILFF